MLTIYVDRMHVIIIELSLSTVEIVCVLEHQHWNQRMAQQLKHTRPFDSEDITEWLNRFKICAKANGWDAAVKAVKLPTLLKGKALAVWLDFTKKRKVITLLLWTN